MQDAHAEESNAETSSYRDSVNAQLHAIEQRLDRLLEQQDGK
jgi:voltage-gated sodium channel